MVAWLKALLFVGGGLAAAGGTAYVTGMLDPWIGRTPPIVAALPEVRAPETPAPSTPPAAAETVPQPEDPVTTEKQPRLAPPTFDLLRVEPDGSMVVAGNAPSRARVEVLSGDSVLGTAEAGAGGDFVVVLDEPLAPGDYQVVLRAVTGGEAVMSLETAIVSIPDSLDGQVLAMVEQPGEPARIITAPEPPVAAGSEPEATEPEVAAAPEEPEADVAAAPEEPEPAAPEVAAAPENAPEGTQDEVAAGDEPAEPEIAADEPQAPAEEEVAAAPEEEAAGSEVASDTGGPEADEPEVAAAPEPEAAGEEAAATEEAPAEADVAAAPAPEEPEVAAQPEPAAEHRVVVEAVEIEGDTVFVAGYADPGSTVRVYANALLLGDARASDGGRFLVEATRELPVGNYVIRADLLAEDGTVLARAAVPFEREPGESIAAVAPPAGQAPDEPEADEEIAAAPEPEASAPAEEAIASTPEPETTAPAGEPEAPIVADEPAAPEQEPEVAAAPPADEPEAEAEADVAAAPPAAEDPELTAPKLQRADGAVIIRRGDNLWRISRRVYGKGIRYSTIYLANQDQIHDPNRIWPGQVFAVPQETPEGDMADMEAIGEQVVSPDTESRIIR